jgi:hypothetical protein
MSTETIVLTRSVIEEYINSKNHLTTELTKIYQCPSTIKASAILLMHATNIDDLTDGSVTIAWSDYSDLDEMTYFISDGNLPARSGLNILHGKFFLEPSDSIWAKADAMDRIHLTMSILEIS